MARIICVHLHALSYLNLLTLRIKDSPFGICNNNASVWMVNAEFFKPIKLPCKVIKPPPQEQQAIENMVFRFKLDMYDLSALSRLNHPNIVRYYDVITIPDKETHFSFSAVCIFTEMCHGDVLNILDEMPVLDWNQNRHIFRQISEALSYLHNEPQGLHTIVHLDIKPENILFKMGKFPVNLKRKVLSFFQ